VRARIFAIARFTAYALVIAIGVSHIVGRDEASGETPSPVTVIDGKTTQGLPVTAHLSDGRVVKVELTWRATCTAGNTIKRNNYFLDSGDFQRDGERFTDAGLIRDGRRGALAAHVEGDADNGVVRGSADFRLSAPKDTCESGPVGFALDLPR
jgi:hypothetical protein